MFLSSGQRHARLVPFFGSQEGWHWPSEPLQAAWAGSCSAPCQRAGGRAADTLGAPVRTQANADSRATEDTPRFITVLPSEKISLEKRFLLLLHSFTVAVLSDAHP